MNSPQTPVIASEEVVALLNKDLKAALGSMCPREVRFLVDAYYQMQDNRIRAGNQLSSMGGEPHAVIDWLFANSDRLEAQVKLALQHYAKSQPMGRWAMEIKGIGPVIAAGLLAHIDIDKAPTVGHIWRYAGLDCTVNWAKREVYDKWVARELPGCEGDLRLLAQLAAATFGRKADSLLLWAGTDWETGEAVEPTAARLAKALARRPWNGQLRTLCWKIGESFVKVSGQDDAFYGKLYLQRKAEETIKNDRGDYADQAARTVTEKNWSRGTTAYKAYTAGHLPPGHIHARAKRWAVKIFLSHWHAQAFRLRHGKEAPVPYAVAHLGHAHVIEAQNGAAG